MQEHLINEISVFFPCYNEEKNITSTFEKALPVIQKVSKKYEVILINDGSKDKTGEIIDKIKSKYPAFVKTIHHNPNRGYGAALKSGFYNSKYDWIVFTDADGQFDFSEITKLIEVQKKNGSDLVIGYYLGRKVSAVRIWGTAMWQIAVYILFGLKVRDIDCGFKLIRKDVIDKIPKLEAERGPFISSEFLIKSKKAGYIISEVGVNHFDRKEGEATGAKLNVILAGLQDLITLWFKMNFQGVSIKK